MGVVGRVKNLLGPPAVTYDALNTKKNLVQGGIVVSHADVTCFCVAWEPSFLKFFAQFPNSNL